jgi:hypothetical protein
MSNTEGRLARGSTSCVPRSRNCISCTKVTASSVSVASRVFNPKCTSCVPRLERKCIG